MYFSSSIYSLSRTGMESLYLCIWKIIMSYRSKTLAFLGGRRNRELPEGKTFPTFFFHCFWKSSFFLLCVLLLPTVIAGEHLCSLHKWIQRVADCAWRFLWVTAATVCRCFFCVREHRHTRTRCRSASFRSTWQQPPHMPILMPAHRKIQSRKSQGGFLQE